MEEMLIWVNEKDNIVGYGEKLKTHEIGQLHRAFSLFIYDCCDQRMLIQKRAEGKYHSGGLWTNSCCSHPRKGEYLRDAVIRRVYEELGINLVGKDCGCNNRLGDNLVEVGTFQYYHNFGRYAESEIDHVFYLPVMSEEVKMRIDTSEVADVRWISLTDLKSWLENSPGDFTVWFQKGLELVLRKITE
ncbi:MAG: isopentenyl-diphosphate Delta-isomerase [Bacteroides thetaiotaomicron]|nr:isopentenyl-diphosphate Delta-isomerase [Bacteroides thetaiotaomicron]